MKVFLVLIFASCALTVRGEVLTEAKAEYIVDVAWQNYLTFIAGPDPIKDHSMVTCHALSGAYSCEVRGDLELPPSLVEPVFTYFRLKTTEKASLRDPKYKTVDNNRLNLILERLTVNFELHFPLQKSRSNQLMEEVLVSLLE